jgi:hypothetical protein
MCNNKQVAKPCKNCGVGLYWYTDRRDGKSHAYEKFGQPNTWHFCVKYWKFVSNNVYSSIKRNGW